MHLLRSYRRYGRRATGPWSIWRRSSGTQGSRRHGSITAPHSLSAVHPQGTMLQQRTQRRSFAKVAPTDDTVDAEVEMEPVAIANGTCMALKLAATDDLPKALAQWQASFKPHLRTDTSEPKPRLCHGRSSPRLVVDACLSLAAALWAGPHIKVAQEIYSFLHAYSDLTACLDQDAYADLMDTFLQQKAYGHVQAIFEGLCRGNVPLRLASDVIASTGDLTTPPPDTKEEGGMVGSKVYHKVIAMYRDTENELAASVIWRCMEERGVVPLEITYEALANLYTRVQSFDRLDALWQLVAPFNTPTYQHDRAKLGNAAPSPPPTYITKLSGYQQFLYGFATAVRLERMEEVWDCLVYAQQQGRLQSSDSACWNAMLYGYLSDAFPYPDPAHHYSLPVERYWLKLDDMETPKRHRNRSPRVAYARSVESAIKARETENGPGTPGHAQAVARVEAWLDKMRAAGIALDRYTLDHLLLAHGRSGQWDRVEAILARHVHSPSSSAVSEKDAIYVSPWTCAKMLALALLRDSWGDVARWWRFLTIGLHASYRNEGQSRKAVHVFKGTFAPPPHPDTVPSVEGHVRVATAHAVGPRHIDPASPSTDPTATGSGASLDDCPHVRQERLDRPEALSWAVLKLLRAYADRGKTVPMQRLFDWYHQAQAPILSTGHYAALLHGYARMEKYREADAVYAYVTGMMAAANPLPLQLGPRSPDLRISPDGMSVQEVSRQAVLSPDTTRTTTMAEESSMSPITALPQVDGQQLIPELVFFRRAIHMFAARLHLPKAITAFQHLRHHRLTPCRNTLLALYQAYGSTGVPPPSGAELLAPDFCPWAPLHGLAWHPLRRYYVPLHGPEANPARTAELLDVQRARAVAGGQGVIVRRRGGKVHHVVPIKHHGPLRFSLTQYNRDPRNDDATVVEEAAATEALH